MVAAIAFPGFLLTLAAVVLLILTTVSTPIWKQLYFLSIHGASSTDASGSLRLGTLGYCSDLAITGVTLTSGCSKTKLGYALDSSLFSDVSDVTIAGHTLDLTAWSSSLIKGLTYVLILQPIAAGFAFLTFLFAFLAFCGGSRIFEILAFIMTLLSTVIVWVAWAVAMALFSIARNRVADASDDTLKGSYGAALWLSLAAAICMTLAIIFTCCGMFGPYKNRDRRERYSQREMEQTGYAGTGTVPYQSRRKFWQRRA